jgi:hypothetical protein
LENFTAKLINNVLKSTSKKLIALITILVGLVVIITGFIYIYQLSDYYKWSIQMSHISSMSIDQRYSNAIRDKNIHFLGIIGEGISFPEVDNKIDIKKYRNIIIDSTGDMILSKEQHRFKGFAEQYAKEFNLKMLEYINSTKQ